MLVFLTIYFYVGVQGSWLTEKQVYVTASVSELLYVTAFAGLGRFLTHPRLFQVFGSLQLCSLLLCRIRGNTLHSSFLFWMKGV